MRLGEGYSVLVVRMTIFITILGVPLSLGEFILLIIVLPIVLIIGTAVAIIKYKEWRRRRLARALVRLNPSRKGVASGG